MTNNSEDKNMATSETADSNTWHLNALTAALGDLTLNVSDSLSVGRGGDNDVVLGSKQVSRNHALLSVLNGQLYIKDLDSSNGTFINEERIEGNKSELLSADDTVGFASFSFKVMQPTAAANTNANTNVSADEIGIEQPVVAAAKISTSATEAVNPEITPMPVIDKEMADAEIDELAEPLVDLDTTESQSAVSSPVEPIVEEETVVSSNIVDDGSSVDNSLGVDDVLNASEVEQPVVKETIIAEVLSATVSSKETLNNEALISEPVVSEPVYQQPVQEEAIHQNPITTSEIDREEHDKTTKTELQQEADPDVLRAKQAATGQFSGTANLGQARDIGTEGNNAMSQAIHNPANSGHVEKKPSGGWFIWVFIAIIIIGLALWLFNMGGA